MLSTDMLKMLQCPVNSPRRKVSILFWTVNDEAHISHMHFQDLPFRTHSVMRIALCSNGIDQSATLSADSRTAEMALFDAIDPCTTVQIDLVSMDKQGCMYTSQRYEKFIV